MHSHTLARAVEIDRLQRAAVQHAATAHRLEASERALSDERRRADDGERESREAARAVDALKMYAVFSVCFCVSVGK